MLPDLIFIAVFAIAAPLLDQTVFWPAHRRLAQADPAWARIWLCKWTIGTQWALVALGVALWLATGRSFPGMGFRVPEGWRLWGALGLCLLLVAYQGCTFAMLARSAEHRAAVRQQMASLDDVMPRTRAELRWFGGVSVTAGFCEEFLYRGCFIGVFTPWLGWWGAAALSLPFFAVAHFYQGWSGVLRTAVGGAVFTLIVAAFQSLWPAIVIHALVDLGSGVMAWLAWREQPASAVDATN